MQPCESLCFCVQHVWTLRSPETGLHIGCLVSALNELSCFPVFIRDEELGITTRTHIEAGRLRSSCLRILSSSTLEES